MRPSCDPQATLKPGDSEMLGLIIAGVPLELVSSSLAHRSGLGQQHAVSTGPVPGFDSRGLAIIQMKSLLHFG